MRRPIPLLSTVMVLIMVFQPQASRAAKVAYVTETHEIALRTGADSRNRVVAMVPPGTAVEIVRTRNEWSLVRYVGPTGERKEGWVQSRFLSEGQTKELETELQALREKIAQLEKDRELISQKERESRDKLAGLATDYEVLKNGSSNFLKLKSEYDSLKTALESAQDNIRKLIQENKNLKLAERIKWFLAGAAVFFFGFVMGMAAGRYQRKRRATQYR